MNVEVDDYPTKRAEVEARIQEIERDLANHQGALRAQLDRLYEIAKSALASSDRCREIVVEYEDLRDVIDVSLGNLT